ncbi:transposase [Sinorhizobium meliloti]|uniref:transposase n=1 Tax=Rhizobium meliloti TaxID=382 RepID=UPI0039890807
MWTTEVKLRILAEVETSGSGVAEIARRHDILPQQIRKHLIGRLAVSATNSPPCLC